MSGGHHGRPTWAEIDLSALRWNIGQVRRLVGPHTHILGVVKANAYGHGASHCAKILARCGVRAFGVASVEEAEELRCNGIRKPLVVFGISQPDESVDILKKNLQPTVVDLAQAEYLSKAAKRKGSVIYIHVKVDTGMGRIGINPSDSADLAQAIKKLPGIEVAGIFTHFSHADGSDKRLLQQQLGLLQKSVDAFKQAGHRAFMVHASNSAAVMESPQAYLDMVRPGLMLYGIYPARRFGGMALLKPVLSWKTKIVQLKTVSAGTGLSYSHTFITKKKSVIATLPVGYADGFSRALSNRGQVLVRGQRCPIVGRVCMDMCLVDVSLVKGAMVGDEVVLIGQQGENQLSVDEMAEKLDTIAYEVLCSVSSRVPRIPTGGMG